MFFRRSRLITFLTAAFRRPHPLSSQQAYALWAEHYPPHAHNRLMEIEQAAMLRLMPDLAGRRVLDLACGTGRYGRLAREAGARLVIGVDNSLPMLRAAGKYAGQSDQSGLVAEAPLTALPFGTRAFDVILCGLAVGHLSPEAMSAAFKEMARVLQPGGEVVFSDFHPYLALSGGQRTFTRKDGRLVAVEHHIHLISQYFTALHNSSMIMVNIEESQVEMNGRLTPAVLVIRGQRLEY